MFSSLSLSALCVSLNLNSVLGLLLPPPTGLIWLSTVHQALLADFHEELEILLSSLIQLGDFNIRLESSQSAGFLPLLHSIDLAMLQSVSIHRE